MLKIAFDNQNNFLITSKIIDGKKLLLLHNGEVIKGTNENGKEVEALLDFSDKKRKSIYLSTDKPQELIFDEENSEKQSPGTYSMDTNGQRYFIWFKAKYTFETPSNKSIVALVFGVGSNNPRNGRGVYEIQKSRKLNIQIQNGHVTIEKFV